MKSKARGRIEKFRAMASTSSCLYDVDEVAALLADDERFEGEIGDLDLDGESEDEFESVGDFLDDSGSQALVADDILSPVSARILALAQDNPDLPESDSLLKSTWLTVSAII